MPSLKMPNPFRRGADRPSLKERAAALKATAGRVMRRPKPAEAAGLIGDLHAMVGGVEHPDGTMSFCDASGRVLHRPVADWIGFTVQRLYSQARKEMARQLGDPSLRDEDRAALAVKLRRDLRLDALGIAFGRSREAFDVATAAECEGTQATIPAPNVFPSGPISADLHAAVEAHREAREMMVHDPVEDDARTAGHVARITALGDAVRAVPARTLADLRHKVIYLWPGALSGEVADDEVADTFSSFRADVMELARGPDPNCADFLARTLLHGLDLTGASMRTLLALRDHANTLSSVCHGLAAQPRSLHSDRRPNEAGQVLHRLVDDLLAWIEEECTQEARGRSGVTGHDRDMRNCLLSRPTVENADPNELRAFARDLVAMAEG